MHHESDPKVVSRALRCSGWLRNAALACLLYSLPILATAQALNAAFVSQTVPMTMTAGQLYSVSIKMKNTGTETWIPSSSYILGSQNPIDNTVWGVNRVVVNAFVLPGMTGTISFSARAPTTPGTYSFQWRMAKVGSVYFGATSPNLAVSVVAAGAANAVPVVQLTSPLAGAASAAPGIFALGASASDSDGLITQVQFFANGSLIHTDTSAPYAYSLAGLAAGSYSLTAKAFDNVNATATTPAVAVVVTAAASGPSLTRTYVYDAYERLCKTIDPEAGATILDYDAAGNIAWSVSGSALTGPTCDRGSVPVGGRTTRSYDSMNRQVAVSTPGGTADVATTYFPDGLVETLTAANPGGYNVVTRYGYNKRRLLTTESSLNADVHLTLGYGYNSNGYLSALSYPDGDTIGISPDALGRTMSISSLTAGGPVHASNVTYHANGAIAGFTYLGGAVHTMTQNARRLPERSRDASGAIVVIDDTYRFDASGNVLDITDRAQGGLTTRGMAYDGLDRLTAAVSPQQWGNASYAYDALDNLRSANQGARQFRYDYEATTNRLASIRDPAGATLFDFGYDPGGNVIRKGPQAYAFDSANRLSQVTGKETYRYDGQGRRVQTTDADGKTTFWIYGQNGQVLYTSEGRRARNISYIYLGNTQVATRTFAWGTGMVTMRALHTDALGSQVATTSITGGLLRRVSYAPYGETTGPIVVDGHGYTGHVMDAVTGLIYMQQRYYDPQVGRFLSVDPVASDVSTAWNFSRYNYAANNPYKYTDPDGRIIDTVADVIFIAADVAVIASEGATATNVLALGADIVGAFIPGATGLGAGVRTASQAYTGSKLARSMHAAGRSVTKGLEQAHHIVAQGAKAAGEAREVLASLGIKIHSETNGAAAKTASHAVMHTKAYYQRVNTAIVAASKQKDPKAAVEKALRVFQKEIEK